MFRYSEYYLLALVAGAFAAFWPRYLSRSPYAVDAYTHAHAFVMTAWCAVLVAQPFLIRTRRRMAHRRIGILSYAIAPALVVTSVLLAHQRFGAMDDRTFAAEAQFLYLPLSAVALFAIAYSLGVRHRKDAALHARFMLCTALTFIDPVLGRIMGFYAPPLPDPRMYQTITFGLTDAILVFWAWRERHQRRARWAVLLMLVVFAVAHVLWFTTTRGRAWHAFADRFRTLPLT